MRPKRSISDRAIQMHSTPLETSTSILPKIWLAGLFAINRVKSTSS